MFLEGLLIGFSIGIPIGPIALLCIRRTLASGRVAGIASGFGVATADAFYGSVAALGASVVSGFIIAHHGWVRLFGGMFLAFFGLKILWARVVVPTAVPSRTSLIGNVASTFFLTLTNPMTFLAFLAIFTGLGLVDKAGSWNSHVPLVAGIFCGSALWWTILCSTVGFFRTSLTQRGMLVINRVSGSIILIFGMVAIGSFFRPVSFDIHTVTALIPFHTHGLSPELKPKK